MKINFTRISKLWKWSFILSILFVANLSFGQIVNGDFESWTGDTPDGWTTIDTGFELTQNTDTVHGGTSAAAFNVLTGDQASTDFRQTISVVGGTEYNVSVFVYHTEGFLKARLYVDTYQGYSDNTITAAWQEMTYTFTPDATGDIEIGLRFYDQSGFDGAEMVYVDDYTISGGSTDPVISVTMPETGTQWLVGTTQNITWTALFTNDYLSIEYSANASDTTPTWVELEDSVMATAGTFAWDIPGDLTTGTDYQIKLTDIDEESTFGLSGIFEIIDELPLTSISEIQFTSDPSGDSPYANQAVNTVGVVTASTTGKYFIQEGSGMYSGLYVYDDTNTAFVGDHITISGTVVEYYNLTELGDVTSYIVNSSDNDLPEPEVVTVEEVGEPYEGVLVQLQNVECTNADAGYGQWEMTDASGSMLTDDDFYAFTPEVGTFYNVTGVVTYTYGEFKVLPTDSADIEVVPAVEVTLNVNMNYQIMLGNFDPDTSNLDVAGDFNDWLGTAMDDVDEDGIYSVTITDQLVGSAIEFKFRMNGAWDGTEEFVGGSNRVYIVQDSLNTPVFWYNDELDIELTSIYDIQYTDSASGDSPYLDSVVTTVGVVTASASGKYFLQDEIAPWNGLYVDDNTNEAIIGDRIVITGTITEYYNLTELMSITEYTVLSSNNPVYAYGLTVSEIGEAFEGQLIHLANVTCSNADAGYGQWEITDETGSMLADDDLFGYTPGQGYVYNVTGVINYSYGEFKVLPRDENDIELVSIPVLADVTLNVNMNYQIDLGNFNPADSLLDVAGSFNDWTGTLMSDDDQDGVYDVTITDLAVGSAIEFKFRMNGDWDGTEEFPGGSNRVYVVMDSLNSPVYIYNDEVPGLTTIYEIQYTDSTSGDSPYMDSVVTTMGVVTASGASKYFLQDEIAPWNGLYVYDNTNEAVVGDIVVVTGTIAEYYNLTELTDITEYFVMSSDNDVYSYILPIADVGESFEGQLITLENVECTAAADGYGQWELTDETGSMLADDDLYAYTPSQGYIYNVTGVVTYSFGEFKILPRDESDIVIVQAVEYTDVTLNVNMNYQIDLGNFNPADSLLDVAGSFEGWTGTLMNDDDQDGIYDLTITDLEVGSMIEFKFRMNGAWDGTEEFAGGGPNRMYVVQDSLNSPVFWYNDEIDGVTSIYDIQYTDSTSGDSPYMDSVVTTVGVVTASGLSKYFIQDEVAPWHGLYVYDNTNVAIPGDRISVTGSVTEYYNLTELTDITGYEVLSSNNNIDSYVTTIGELDESFEAVLVHFENVECTNADAGYGQWEITDGVDTMLTDDDIFGYTPVQGHTYNLTGVITYSFGEFKLLPRFEEDIENISEEEYVDVTLNVNMNYQIEIGNFNPDSSLLDVAGSFNGWAGTPMDDPDEDGIYTLTIVEQIVGSDIEFKFRRNGAWDGTEEFYGGDNRVYTVLLEDNNPVYWYNDEQGEITIYDIQYTTDPSGVTPYLGETVTVSGVVTAVKSNNNFYIQDGTGMWNGVLVYQYDFEVAQGDDITITALVDEYGNMTELKNPEELVINSSGNDLPAVNELEVSEVDEPYEGTLISLQNIVCVSGVTSGNWYVASGNDTLIIRNDFFDYEPVVGATYNITGLVGQYYEDYQVYPRDSVDIELVGGEPFLSISSPEDGATVYSTDVTVEFAVLNFVIGEPGEGIDGHIYYHLVQGGEPTIMYHYTTDPIELTELGLGEHILYMQLVDNEHNPLDPPVEAAVTFTIEEQAELTIYDIQYTEDPSGDSEYLDETVTVSGIVTAVKDNNNFYIQDGTGMWNGVNVYQFDYEVAQGDDITIIAEVAEYANLTELTYPTNVTINSSGNDLPAVNELEIAEVDEPYEGTFISLTEVVCVEGLDGSNWYVSDGTDTLLIRNDFFDFTPTLDAVYNITGLVSQYYENYQVFPRDAGDIVQVGDTDPPFVTDVLVEDDNTVLITFNEAIDQTSAEIAGNYEITPGVTVEEPIFVSPNFVMLTATGITEGDYTLTVNGVEDLAGNATVNETYEFTVYGDLTIYDIQYTEDPSGDSPFLGQDVTVSGIVTAVKENNNFYIQDGTGMWNGILVYQYDFTVEKGDNVTVTAEVVEYANLTELQYAESVTINSNGNELPAVNELIIADVDEPYEGTLIALENVICVEELDGLNWKVAQGTDTLIVRNDIYAFTPVLGIAYNLTGLVAQYYENYQLYPRDENDIEALTNSAPEITWAGVPDSVAVDSIINMWFTIVDNDPASLTIEFKYGIDEDNLVNEADVVLEDDLYEVTLQPSQTVGEVIFWNLSVTDGEFTDEISGSFFVYQPVGINILYTEVYNFVYPNPVTHILFVKNTENLESVAIFNNLGEKLMTVSENEIVVEELPAGMYFVEIVLKDGSRSVQRVMKQ